MARHRFVGDQRCMVYADSGRWDTDFVQGIAGPIGDIVPRKSARLGVSSLSITPRLRLRQIYAKAI